MFVDGGSGRCRARLMCPVCLITTTHQKQSVHWLRACRTCAACNGLVSLQKTSSMDGDAQLYQLLLQDVWDGSRLWGFLLTLLHFFGIQIILLARCQLLLSILIWVWPGRPSFPKSIPSTEAGYSNIFTLACLVAINY